MNDEAIYLYCFARPGAAQGLDASGVADGGEVAEVSLDGAAAVIGRVPLDDFSGEGAEGRLQDPDWVIPRAYRHERVVEAVMRHSPVLPARFGAVFSGMDKVEALLCTRHREITGFLDSVAGKEEWAAKGFLDAEAASEWLLASDTALAAERGRLPEAPGARYFQEKKLRAAARGQVASWCRDAIERICAQLVDFAAATCPLKSRGWNASGPADSPVFHCACLLERGRVAGFRAAVERLNAEHATRGLTLEASGPWPLYSFCPDIGDARA